MSKHTPTPYYVEPDMGGTYNITVGPPTGLIIAKVNPYNDVPDEMAMHNAMRLAKAANSYDVLLTALSGLLAEFDHYDAEMTKIGRGHEDYGGQRDSARALILRLTQPTN